MVITSGDAPLLGETAAPLPTPPPLTCGDVAVRATTQTGAWTSRLGIRSRARLTLTLRTASPWTPLRATTPWPLGWVRTASSSAPLARRGAGLGTPRPIPPPIPFFPSLLVLGAPLLLPLTLVTAVATVLVERGPAVTSEAGPAARRAVLSDSLE